MLLTSCVPTAKEDEKAAVEETGEEGQAKEEAETPPSTSKPTTTETILTPEPPPPSILSVNISPRGAGSVFPPSGKYALGLQVPLTASPSTGYIFDYWDGDAIGSDPKVTIVMTSNLTIIAHFKTIETQTPEPTPISYTLFTSVYPPGGGSISPPSGEHIEGELKNVIATPSSGYTFDHWSGDAEGKSATIIMRISSNKTVIANFTLIPTPVVELDIGSPFIEEGRKTYTVSITNHNNYSISVNLAKKVVNLQGVTVESSQWLEILDIRQEETYYTQISCGSDENLTLALSGITVDVESVAPQNLARLGLPSTRKESEDITVLDTLPISVKYPESPGNIIIKNNSDTVRHVSVVQTRLYDPSGRLLGVKYKTFGTPGWEFQPLESWIFSLQGFSLRYNPDPSDLRYVVRVFE